jgi:TatA/E family protein of Tat protein translocase
MFGSLGVPELLLIFAVILIVFGPRRIPEIGRTLGKALGEFRKATDDLKSTIEREVRLEELKKIAPPTLDSFMTPTEAVSRTEPYGEETFPPAPSTIAASDATAPDASPADVTPEDAAAPGVVEVEPGK